ncbi:hypothetical protein T492DRAFT_625248 [Pavlovales sp. CCMP2436]|nr:hypothetical protein T492DRAFT_625248 [Pavlovales sp. CCMP2436]
MADVSMRALERLLATAGSDQPAEAAELLVSEALVDLGAFCASTRLTGELLYNVRACACARALHMPLVSFAALDKARGTLEDFAKTYLPLHGLEPVDILRFMPELVYVESAIYAMDEANEQLANLTEQLDPLGFSSEATLLGVLDARRLLDSRVRAELETGKAYWALERKICRAIRVGEPLDEAEVIRAHELKSFDYRLLNCLVYNLRGVPADQQTLDFLRVDEWLTDLADDLFDYEDDVVKGSFNVYRCFVHLYGASANVRLAERISKLEVQHASSLAALGSVAQQAYRRRRMEDVFSRPGTRTWQIPAPIADEAAYRAAVLAAENSCTGSDGERAQAESATTSKVRGGELTMRRERRVPGA